MHTRMEDMSENKHVTGTPHRSLLHALSSSTGMSFGSTHSLLSFDRRRGVRANRSFSPVLLANSFGSPNPLCLVSSRSCTDCHCLGRTSNLLKMKNANLGHSEPLVSSQSHKSARRLNKAGNRRSFVLAPSSVITQNPHSPQQDLGSPKQHSSQLTSSVVFSSIRRPLDARRWSLASLPSSSGYSTTPASPDISSQCSSHERLHHSTPLRVHSGSHHHSPYDTSALPTISYSHSQPIAASSTSSLASPCPSHRSSVKWLEPQQLLSTSSCTSIHHSLSRLSSSESYFSVDDEAFACSVPVPKLHSHTISSSLCDPVIDINNTIQMNNLYRDRFPKATSQMEMRLEAMLQKCVGSEANLTADSASPSCTAIVRFARHQIMELIRDCLKRSKDKLISCTYFTELTDALDCLMRQTREKSLQASYLLYQLVREFRVCISRPARLLECLEFDPQKFYHLLAETEDEARYNSSVPLRDLPRYVIAKLSLCTDDRLIDSVELDKEDNESISSAAGDSFACSTPTKDTDLSAALSHCSSVSSAHFPSESDYETIKLISNGAYGSVYLVRHLDTGQRCAMKRISKHNLLLRNQVEQVYNERDIMSFSDNPFVVSLFCTFETKLHLCLVMEYVEGGDCATLLKNVGALPGDLARVYFAETVLAVEYLHSFGVVHRDLKPDNLLITALGHIKLTDFGLSRMGLMTLATNLYERLIDTQTSEFSDTQVIGTPEYIAPEVILCQGYGKPVDWWSMGIILYEFLVGCVPFFGDTPEELLSHTVNDDIKWPTEDDFAISSLARDIITQLLVQNPLDRLGTGGSHEVKEDKYFDGLDWDSILRMKVEFIPQLDDENDTSYFDTRLDRFCHDLDESMVDSDDMDESVVFSSFSSCSPVYKKNYMHSVSDGSTIQFGPSGLHKSDRYDSVPNISAQDSVATRDAEVSSPLPSSHLQPIVGSASDTCVDSADTGTVSTPQPHLSQSHHTTDVFTASSGDTGQFTSAICVTTGARDSVCAGTSDVVCGGISLSGCSACIAETLALPVPKSVSAASGLNLISSQSHLNSAQMEKLSLTSNSRTSSLCCHSHYKPSPAIKSKQKQFSLSKYENGGYGFTLRAIRVYAGESHFYTVHHIVMSVDSSSEAATQGLNVGDLVTHISGSCIQGMLHTQVINLIVSNTATRLAVKAVAIEDTTISRCRRRRRGCVLARRAFCPIVRRSHRRSHNSCSVSRRLSSRLDSGINQSAICRKCVNLLSKSSTELLLYNQSASNLSSAQPISEQHVSTPTNTCAAICMKHPSSTKLQGLKHKLHRLTSAARRRSVGHVPLSPLARTPSPRRLSPHSRSPSPFSVSPLALQSTNSKHCVTTTTAELPSRPHSIVCVTTCSAEH